MHTSIPFAVDKTMGGFSFGFESLGFFHKPTPFCNLCLLIYLFNNLSASLSTMTRKISACVNQQTAAQTLRRASDKWVLTSAAKFPKWTCCTIGAYFSTNIRPSSEHRKP
jgi:hypothetical protein